MAAIEPDSCSLFLLGIGDRQREFRITERHCQDSPGVLRLDGDYHM